MFTRSCLKCRHAKKLATGVFCTKNPPSVFMSQAGDKTRITSWYPPIPIDACGQFARRLFAIKPDAKPS